MTDRFEFQNNANHPLTESGSDRLISKEVISASLLSDMGNPTSLLKRDDNSTLSFLPGLEISLTNSLTMVKAESTEATQEGDRKTDSNESPYKEVAAGIAKAISSGDPKELTALLTRVSESLGGDMRKITDLGSELANQLKDKGFDVKFASHTGKIGIHREGALKGVEFQLSNVKGDRSEFKAQAYDWVTKRDVFDKAETVISDFAKKNLPGESGLKDGTELAKLYDKANGIKDFSHVHREMARSAAHAHEAFGMDGVRDLERKVQKVIDRGDFPVLIEDGNKLTIYNARTMPSDDVVKALEDGGLKEKGIFKHPSFGYLKTIQKGPDIELKKK